MTPEIIDLPDGMELVDLDVERGTRVRLPNGDVWYKSLTWIKENRQALRSRAARELEAISTEGSDRKVFGEKRGSSIARKSKREVLSWDAAVSRAQQKETGSMTDEVKSEEMSTEEQEEVLDTNLSPESDEDAQAAHEDDVADATIEEPDEKAGEEVAATKKATKKATSKKASSKKATTKKATTKKAAVKKESTGPRITKAGTPARERGSLELDVKSVTDAFAAGKIELPEGKTLTPHRISQLIASRDDVEAPSTGAVSNVIKRWNEIGFALTDEKPLAFRRYSAKGEKDGLETLKAKAKEKAKAERAAAKS
jgi:hypothetical protein